MAITWSRTNGPSGPSISIVFEDGDIVTVGKEHVSLAEITQKLAADAPEAELRELLQPAKAIAVRLQRLSERVTTDGENIFFDGDALHDTLADYILSLIKLENEQAEAPSWKPFVSFLEKLSQNPTASSRDSLYTFIAKHGLTVRPDGDFIAYKGLQADFGSVRSGPGIVDNVKVNGHLANKPGSVLEMARSSVEANVQIGCAVGLHVGTARYARSWSRGKVVAVAVNPRDVVAVPFDGEFEKVRVARYEVLTELPSEEKVQATVGNKSVPVYSAPTPAAPVTPELDEEFLRKLKRAIKKGRVLEVTYLSSSSRVEKTYAVKPLSIEGNLLKLELPKDDNGARTFRIDRIKSIKKLDS
jgi:hypothetical protein